MADEPYSSPLQTQERHLTVGTVQREIRIGMTAGEVASVLGSPNLVSKTDAGETWVYDKFSTETAYTKKQAGISVLILGGALVGSAGVAGGGVAPSISKASGKTTVTQRTLTIVIDFTDGLVSEFDYHSSRF